MNSLRGVVVGVGNMGRHHARIIAETAGTELVAVVDPDPVARETAARRYGCAAHEQLATVGMFDFAVVAVPTAHHEAVTLEIFERGASVLIEKPLAPTIEGCLRLATAAEHAGVVLAIGHVERFNQAIHLLRERLQRPRLLQFERLSPRTERTSDSVVMDLMVHDLDLACHLTAEEPLTLDAAGSAVYSRSLDFACAHLVFPSGCVAALIASRITHDKIRRIAVSTDTEFLIADALRQDVAVKRETSVEFPDNAQAWYRQASIVEVPRLGPGIEPLKAQFGAFVDALREEGPNMVPPSEAMLAVRLALDIERRVSQAQWS